MSKYLLLQSSCDIAITYNDVDKKSEIFSLEDNYIDTQHYDFILQYTNQVSKSVKNICEKFSDKDFYIYETMKSIKKLYIIENSEGDYFIYENYKDLKIAIATLYEE